LKKIISPTFLIDKKKCLQNIKNMVLKARRHNLKLRPHFKTHQSAEIGSWFRDFGINSIAVSSVEMANYFTKNGWDDITIAFPVNILETDKINKLAGNINLNLLVESAEVTEFLSNHLTYVTGIFIKIDTGYHRTGLSSENTAEIDKILAIIKSNPKLTFNGFLVHAGHTYFAKDKNEILEIQNNAIVQLSGLKEKYINSWHDLIISYGDTPSCSLSENFQGINEIRPGNFVFYDVMQYYIGSCTTDEIAVAMACPVVAKHPERNEIVIYGGAIHFSKEFITSDNGYKIFGYIVKIENKIMVIRFSDILLKLKTITGALRYQMHIYLQFRRSMELLKCPKNIFMILMLAT
jgi:D-serine deaminase-like pyridoxal phosphate-dependent protein